MEKLYVHPLPVRIWHWINALGFIVLILTGIQLRYGELVHVLPFPVTVQVHNWVGFTLIANYFIWLVFYLFTDKIKVYHPELDPAKHFRSTLKQLQYYGYGIFKGDPNPHHVSLYHKFNPLQSMAYQIIMILLVPIQFYTGLLLWDLELFSGSVALFGGVRVVDTIHVALFVFFTAFIFIHPYLASLGHTTFGHFKAMLTGYEDVEDAGTK